MTFIHDSCFHACVSYHTQLKKSQVPVPKQAWCSPSGFQLALGLYGLLGTEPGDMLAGVGYVGKIPEHGVRLTQVSIPFLKLPSCGLLGK